VALRGAAQCGGLPGQTGRSSKTVGVLVTIEKSGLALNRKTANADGVPAAWMVLQEIRKQLVAEHERVEGPSV